MGSSPGGTDIYVPAILRSSYLLANKGYLSPALSYGRDFMTSLSDDNQADITELFNSASRYLDDLLNIDNPYFAGNSLPNLSTLAAID